MSNNNRLQILSPQEFEEIYGIPKFNDAEREFFFNLDPIEKYAHDQYRSSVNKCFYALQLAYFKAKQMFFQFEGTAINDDVNYLQKSYAGISIPDILSISTSTRGRQQKSILRIHGYKSFEKKDRIELENKAEYWAKVSVKPSFIFRELLKHLVQSKTIFPSYSTMQDLIGRSIQNERQRIEVYFKKNLNKNVMDLIDKLLGNDEKDYSLTKIKKDSKDFSHNQIRGEVDKRQKLLEIYKFSKIHLPKLKLSNESIKYYASMINHYSMRRLMLIPKASAQLYLISFAHYKVQKINNNLLKGFIYLVDNFIDEAAEISKEDVYNHRMITNERLTNAAEVWDLFTNEYIADLEAFGKVRNQAFSWVSKEDFPEVKKLILAKTFDREEFTWQAIDKLSFKFKKNLRIIFLNVDFMSQINSSLYRATNRVKQLLVSGKSLKKSVNNLLLGFVPDNVKKYIAPDGRINADRYEFYLYRILREKLDSGDIFSTESLDFRSFEDDLIPKQQFKLHKDKLLKEAGLSQFIDHADKYLDREDSELHAKYIEVNSNLKSGKNKNLNQVKKKGEKRWQLKYVKSQKANNQRFFGALPQVDIYWVMKYCDSLVGFTKAFPHVSGKSGLPNIKHLFASLIGLGVNAGISKMAKMSGISHNDLMSVYINYVNLENIREATDRINNATAQLPTFDIFGPGIGMVHSSSDGQKFETRFPTMKSRYSKKYFGLKKGVSAYSLVIHGVPANAMVIGSNEHESHFVFDVIHNNSTDIETEQHSTDSHGINKANFFLLNAFGCQFAPRLNSANEKIGRLVSFRDLRSYKNFLIKPYEKGEREKIESEWENVQRILVSLATKTTTQNIIVKKLSSHKRQNSTKEAIWELDRIHESKYILDYIDDHTIPQNVQRSLNQGEQYHGLRRAITGNNAGMGSKSDLELEIWNECSRLLAACIVHYNNHILSSLITRLKEEDPKADIGFIQKISPIAWCHINLLGKYDLDKENAIEIEKILEAAIKEIM